MLLGLPPTTYHVPPTTYHVPPTTYPTYHLLPTTYNLPPTTPGYGSSCDAYSTITLTSPRFGGYEQSMEWTGSIRWIHNPVQSRRIWIGLDQKFTNSADSGLDWIEKCAKSRYLIFRYLRQFLHIATLASEVLSSNIQLYTSSLVLTC